MAVDMVHLPDLMSSCALPSHTSVPCARPAIRTRSEKHVGLASISICIAKSVPNSGTPRLPRGIPLISSGVIFLSGTMHHGRKSDSGVKSASGPSQIKVLGFNVFSIYQALGVL